MTDRVGLDVQVTMVRLEVGRLSGASVDALRFCFEICTAGTVLHGAALEIAEIPGRARCRTCGLDGPIDPPVSACACGSFDRQLICGGELRLKEVEVI